MWLRCSPRRALVLLTAAVAIVLASCSSDPGGAQTLGIGLGCLQMNSTLPGIPIGVGFSYQTSRWWKHTKTGDNDSAQEGLHRPGSANVAPFTYVSYSRRMQVVDPETLLVTWENNRSVKYVRAYGGTGFDLFYPTLPNGTPVPPRAQVRGFIRRDPYGIKDGRGRYILHYPDGMREYYDDDGSLVAQEEPWKNRVYVTYDTVDKSTGDVTSCPTSPDPALAQKAYMRKRIESYPANTLGNFRGFPSKAGDLNDDYANDAVVQDAAGDHVRVWVMNGLRQVVVHDLGVLAAGANLLGTGDFDGDGQTDVLLRDRATGRLTVAFRAPPAERLSAPSVRPSGVVALVDANGNPQLAPNATESTPDTMIGTADWNGDGKADITFGGANGSVTVLLVDGNKVTGTSTVFSRSGNYSALAIGDFNRDTLDDILWSDGSGNLAVGYSTRNGPTFGTSSYAALVRPDGTPLTFDPSWARVVGTGDLNGDGWPDIVFQNKSNSTATSPWADFIRDRKFLDSKAFCQATPNQESVCQGSEAGAAVVTPTQILTVR